MEGSNVKNKYTSPEMLVVKLSPDTVLAASGTGSFEDFGSGTFNF